MEKSQITQMITFIEAEARDKVADIKKKGDEEFNIEVHRMINDGKDKLRKKFEIEEKKRDTNAAIEKSLAINKQRLEKIKARQEQMAKITDDVKAKLKRDLQNESTSKPFVTKLIVQGLLMLLENEVSVQCKKADQNMVESCLNEAKNQYASVIKKETGADKTVNIKINKTNYLSETLIGGVVLACQDDKITIDNTIDLRLKLVMDQDKPAIREQLFGEPKSLVNGGSPQAKARPVTAAPAPSPPAAVPAAVPAAAPPPQQAQQQELQVGMNVLGRYSDGSIHPATVVKVDKKKANGKVFRVEWQQFPGDFAWLSQAEIQQ